VQQIKAKEIKGISTYYSLKRLKYTKKRCFRSQKVQQKQHCATTVFLGGW
jgi:hypothetical protein